MSWCWETQLRGTSHYGWRSRGHRFPPIKLQETKSSVSRPFTLWPKSKGCRNLKWLLFEEGDGLSKKVWVRWDWKPKLWSRGRRFFFIKNQSLTISWPLDWRGYFEQGIMWDTPLGLDFGLGLWRLHTMAIQVKRPWEFMAKGMDFGLGLCMLHTMLGRRLHLLCFINYFQPISLDSQQSLTTQSHGLSTWMAIVWSGP
jgi:hypothetical protein